MAVNAWTDLHLSLQLPPTTLTASRNDPWCRLHLEAIRLSFGGRSLQVDQRAKLYPAPPSPSSLLPSAALSCSTAPRRPPFSVSSVRHISSFDFLIPWCYRLMRAGQGVRGRVRRACSQLFQQPAPCFPKELGLAPGICAGGGVGIPDSTLQPVSAPATSPTPAHRPDSLSD